MADEANEADVFAVPDFWKTSKWLDQLAKEASTSLFGNGLDVLYNAKPTLLPLTPIKLDTDGFFQLPQDKDFHAESQDDNEGFETAHWSVQEPFEFEDKSDVWMHSSEPPPKPAIFRTWETFNTGIPKPHVPLFLSEAGAGAYDALLNWPTDSLELANTNTPVVETNVYFASVLALSVGRESVFFARTAKGTLKPTLPELRISGYTRQVLQGVERQAGRCGSTFLRLSTVSRSAYISSSSRCAVALASAMNQILQAVEYQVTVDGRFPRSLLHLQTTITGASAILRPLDDLVSRMSENLSDEEILSLVFQEASMLEFSEGYVRDVLCEILRRISSPWLESIEEWLGTRREVGTPFTKSSIGETRGFVKVDVEIFTDDFGREVEDVDFRLDARKVPEFLPQDIAESIFETGRNLRFVRAFHPDHVLARSDAIMSNRPPAAEWLFDWESILNLESRVAQYQERLVHALRQSRSSTTREAAQFRLGVHEPGSEFKLQFFGFDQNMMEQRLLESMDQLDQPFMAKGSDDSLCRLVRARLSKVNEDDAAASDNTPHWSLLPILSFGGIAAAQARIVNRESLRLLFEVHGVQDHLKLQRDFHLLGNGLFCSRLSHALFDPDLETAERRAGVAMQGGVMGLRLGGRDTWPPAGSELRLALMGVLSEAYHSGLGKKASVSTKLGSDASLLPGDLSFAVRDLSSEEIDKCMNPDTLEALDFLRLSYSTPPELTSIITPLHLMHYDRIFKLLLRILRMLYIVNQLYRDTNSRLNTWFEEDASYRFVRESQHFVSSIASYFLDSGVTIPWQTFERKLDVIRVELDKLDVSTDGASYSPKELQEMHSLVLERIMHALFLRKRQLPVLKLLEEIFTTILLYAKQSRLQALGREQESGESFDPAHLYAEFKKKVQVFITVCRGLSEKSKASSKRTTGGITFDEFGIGDDSLVAQLVTRLDMDDYYCRR
ncbi:gamma-tubulin complex component GCP6 [Pochonia chlamydosporia 170]|uniref:Spindle pole body component n=1 Tax=Pochonia chlamydosporia 170 TaxID=1380566 RepID=A0A179FD23_METCM|nr:gamma-tubulin complex component GCP6 [Pochonia chlamydosporia 170]OAQ63200.1 gamma-tubulin complex component GCP6 [Pochonia chlamydosporia 170]